MGYSTRKRKYTRKRRATGKSGGTKTKRNYVRNTPLYKSAKHLNMVCGNSGYCLAFGRETDKINAFFDNFKSFEYVLDTGGVSLINKGANGFVNEIIFRRAIKPEKSRISNYIPRTHFGFFPSKRSEYKASTILKSHNNEGNDNLLYEYIVGKYYVNKQMKFFPCFLETYGMFMYYSHKLYENMKNKTECFNITKQNLTETLKYMGDNIVKKHIRASCEHQLSLSLLAQYVENPVRISEILKNEYIGKDHSLCDNEMLQILYQVYAPLTVIQNEFTHYDLHTSNVIVSRLKRGTYIQMNYVNSDGNTVSFKTDAIVKILDYGRSYFKLDNNENPLKIRDTNEFYKKVCVTPGCNTVTFGGSKSPSGSYGISINIPAAPPGSPVSNRIPSSMPTEKTGCGQRYGYRFLNPTRRDPTRRHNDYIISSINNVSHDLRFANIIGMTFADMGINGTVQNILRKIIYDGDYGTPEVTLSGFVDNKIHNISDLLNEISLPIRMPTFNSINDNYYKDTKPIGTLTVYLDRSKPMEFIANTTI